MISPCGLPNVGWIYRNVLRKRLIGARPSALAGSQLLIVGAATGCRADLFLLPFAVVLFLVWSLFAFLGLKTAASGSAWVREARRRSTQLLQLVRRISLNAGGARTQIARLHVRGVLQLRLVYQAQFQHMTVMNGDWLDVANRDAMRTITCLPRLTPTWPQQFG